MIKKLNAADYNLSAAFLDKNYLLNTYMLGYIKRFGFDRNFCEVFGAGEKNLSAVMLRYYNTFYISSDNCADFEEIAAFLNMRNDISEITGDKASLSHLSEGLYYKSKKECSFLISNKLFDRRIKSSPIIAQSRDIEEVYILLKSVDTFCLPEYDEFFTSWFYRCRDGGGKTYIIKDNGSIVSTASVLINAEKSAMIGAVATKSDCRGKGYAGDAVYTAAQELLKDNKTPCISFDNPAAGRVYKSLGFEFCDTVFRYFF